VEEVIFVDVEKLFVNDDSDLLFISCCYIKYGVSVFGPNWSASLGFYSFYSSVS